MGWGSRTLIKTCRAMRNGVLQVAPKMNNMNIRALSGLKFDTLIPLIEGGAALGLGFPGVRERLSRSMGV